MTHQYGHYTGPKSGDLEISRQAITGCRIIDVYGCNEDVGPTLEDVWPAGGLRAVVTSSTAITASSTDAQDTAAGTGIRTVRASCLDSNLNELDVDMTLDGLNNVVSTETDILHIQKVEATECGSTGWAEGTVTFTVQGSVQATITPGRNESILTHLVVPAGQTAYIDRLYMNAGRGADVQGTLLIREVGSELWKIVRQLIVHNNYQEITLPALGPYPAGTILKITAITISGGGPTEFAGGYDLKLLEV